MHEAPGCSRGQTNKAKKHVAKQTNETGSTRKVPWERRHDHGASRGSAVNDTYRIAFIKILAKDQTNNFQVKNQVKSSMLVCRDNPSLLVSIGSSAPSTPALSTLPQQCLGPMYTLPLSRCSQRAPSQSKLSGSFLLEP